MQENSAENIIEILKKQRAFFEKGCTKDITFRKKALRHLKRAILLYEEELEEALAQDLGKHYAESYMTEIGFVLSDITEAYKNVERWSADRIVQTPLYLLPGRSRIRKEPYGSVLIIGSYNYPFQLLFEPLVSAIAAGNCAVLKTSRQTPRTSDVIKRLILHAFRPEYIFCAAGGEISTEVLLDRKFDYIFFTGSTRGGRIVMEAAAKHLTPVTLELGGKSPVIVDKTADIKAAAAKIIWGKLLNTGQTCAAPDYVLADESIKGQLLQEMKEAAEKYYGTDAAFSQDYGRIVNTSHFDRLDGILKKDEKYIVYGGERERETRYISPVFFDLGSLEEENVATAACMQEELFGPLLPVIGFDKIRKAVDYINGKEHPLALYLFTSNDAVKEMVLNSTASGGAAVNDTINHIVNPSLPFGGVGNSGMGQYHGITGFHTFTHFRSVFERPYRFAVSPAYPPYSDNKLKLIKKLLH